MTVVPEPLPHGRQFAALWGLERTFGGMTSAMLRRSRTFAEATGGAVDILTFDARDDYDRIVGQLRSNGRLAPMLRVRNLWDELTEATDRLEPPPAAKRQALAGFAPMPAGSRTAVRHARDGTVLQVDRRRPDGTLALSDRRDTRTSGQPGGRSIVLCDAAGAPMFGFTRARPFYHWWLDGVLGDEDGFLLIDSKAAAGVLLDYRSPRVTRVHVIHNSHLDGDVRPWAALNPTRLDILPRLDDFDAAVVLSERQRGDLALLLGASENVEVVPNAAALPHSPPTGPRDPLRGALLASLVERKRVDHAIQAVALARRTGADVRLDIYGDGELRPQLEGVIRELDLEDAVRVRGFRPDALDEFEHASFFLLTSTTEGFPLVLAEGMSRGCIPVSYDIPYGPADIIEDGRSGFLVPPGDVEAMAARIAALAAGVPESMREAAVERASRFSDSVVLQRWREVLERARARQRRPSPDFAASVRWSRLSRQRGSFVAWADFSLRGVDVPPDQVSAAVTLRGPDGIVLRAVGAVRRTLRRGVWRATVSFPPGAAEWLPHDIAFARELELRIHGGLVRVPLPD